MTIPSTIGPDPSDALHMRTEIVHCVVGFTIEKDGDESSGDLKRAAFTGWDITSIKHWCERNVWVASRHAYSDTMISAVIDLHLSFFTVFNCEK